MNLNKLITANTQLHSQAGREARRAWHAGRYKQLKKV